MKSMQRTSQSDENPPQGLNHEEVALLAQAYTNNPKAIAKLADLMGIRENTLRIYLQDSIGRGIAYFMAWAHGKAISRGGAMHTMEPNRAARRRAKKLSR